MRSAASSSSAKRSASCEPNHSEGIASKSDQLVPAAASSRSWVRMISIGSKNPFGLSIRGPAARLGSCPPIAPSAPASAEVPLRCMPSTRIQTRLLLLIDQELLDAYSGEYSPLAPVPAERIRSQAPDGNPVFQV